MQAGQARPTGSELIGNIPWGTHLCLFYQTKEALAEILVPYFQAGLEHNECCIWVTSEPLNVEQAKAALHSAVSNLDDHLQNGRIEILDYQQWYTRCGAFQADAVLQGWIEKEQQALRSGFDGLRISGNTSWIEKQDWQAFTAYEAAIGSVIGEHRMIAVCTYWLDRCGASEIIDVVSNHQFAIIQRQGNWQIVESTEHRRVEAALRQSRRFLQTVIDALPEVTTVIGLDYRVILANRAARELAGAVDPASHGTTCYRLFHHRDSPCEGLTHPCPLRQVVATKAPVAVAHTHYDAQGNEVFVEISAAPVLNEAGEVVQMVESCCDVTARRRAEQEIESLSRFPSENPYPVMRVAADGTLLYINAAAGPLLSEIGCRAGRVLSGECRELNENALQSGSKCRTDIRHDGRVFSFDVVPVSDAGYVNWYGRDITEVRRVKEERERLVAELEAKNAELERFTYTVSHELKSPLITIQGYLGCLEQDAAAGKVARMKEDAARIRAAAGRMRGLLDELLELSRIGRVTNPPQETSLAELAREAVDLLAGPIAQRGVQVEIAPNLPVVLVDRQRLLEVLQNLIENAVKFLGDQPDPRVEIGARRDEHAAGQTVCYVRDNGLGIDPRYHHRVFELFAKLDPQSEGTGVGLALVKRIVEVHGGRVWVESPGHGRGCTFCFTLPRHTGATDHDD